MARVQRYISDELTHFVGRSALGDLETQYKVLLAVLQSGWLTHPPHQPSDLPKINIRLMGRISQNQLHDPQVVCFCDIPVEDFAIHSLKYGRFGLAFKKTILAAKGANPVFYIARTSVIQIPADVAVNPIPKEIQRASRADYFDVMVQAQVLSSMAQRRHYFDSGSVEEGLSQDRENRFFNFYVYSFMKFFDETKADDDPDNFYMEREWRVLGNVQFTLEDVSRLLLPEEFAKRFREDVPDFYKQVTFI
jgi:hypothetical protein